MSAKNLDRHNRWRNKTVAFRVSPDEDREIETAVRLSGLTKQDYNPKSLSNHHHMLFFNKCSEHKEALLVS